MSRLARVQIREVLDVVDRAGAVPGHPELAEWLGGVDWSGAVSVADVVDLRSVLAALELRDGVGPAHRVASAGLLAAVTSFSGPGPSPRDGTVPV